MCSRWTCRHQSSIWLPWIRRTAAAWTTLWCCVTHRPWTPRHLAPLPMSPPVSTTYRPIMTCSPSLTIRRLRRDLPYLERTACRRENRRRRNASDWLVRERRNLPPVFHVSYLICRRSLSRLLDFLRAVNFYSVAVFLCYSMSALCWV